MLKGKRLNHELFNYLLIELNVQWFPIYVSAMEAWIDWVIQQFEQ